jgi:hypothetical protein
MNYLELVNDVLIRLREDEVTAVTDTPYSKLISKYVNDAKRIVEDSYEWAGLTETLTVTTANGLFNYVMTGAGQRFKVLDVINSEDNIFLQYVTTSVMNNWFLNADNTQTGSPTHYNFNGVNANGDTQVDVFPIPDGVYNVFFNIYKPQDALSLNSDKLIVPSEPVIKYAYAMAVAERGEDGGLSAQEATALADQSLADHVAIAQSRRPEEYLWHSV